MAARFHTRCRPTLSTSFNCTPPPLRLRGNANKERRSRTNCLSHSANLVIDGGNVVEEIAPCGTHGVGVESPCPRASTVKLQGWVPLKPFLYAKVAWGERERGRERERARVFTLRCSSFGARVTACYMSCACDAAAASVQRRPERPKLARRQHQLGLGLGSSSLLLSLQLSEARSCSLPSTLQLNGAACVQNGEWAKPPSTSRVWSDG
jgi:hypothetical protein